MNILIGADLVPTKSNMDLFSSGNAEALLGKELLQLVNSKSTYSIFNLETPLCDIPKPISKNGPCLIAPTDSIAGYNAIGVNLLTLANNHILDQGEQGLESTIHTLEMNNIPYLGAGKDLKEASEPYIFDFAGKKVGVYACAEHEFSIATENSMGANPFEPLDTPDYISDLKQKCDYVIVLYHGGKEHYRYPSPNLQKTCRKLIDKGADLVVCQHSHCIGCEEKYHDGTIVYGQGNFLFDQSESEYKKTSLLVNIDETFQITYVPLVKNNNTVRIACGEQIIDILNAFYKRSDEIMDKEFVHKSYIKFSKEMIDGYLVSFSTIPTRSIVFRALNKLSGFRIAKLIVKRKYKKYKLLSIQNFVECQTQRELLLQGLKDKIKNVK